MPEKYTGANGIILRKAQTGLFYYHVKNVILMQTFLTEFNIIKSFEALQGNMTK